MEIGETRGRLWVEPLEDPVSPRVEDEPDHAPAEPAEVPEPATV
jgi:hypothetical protein